jgi:hypothetical protein
MCELLGPRDSDRDGFVDRLTNIALAERSERQEGKIDPRAA